MTIEESFEEPVEPSPTPEQGIIQGCKESVTFAVRDSIIVTNHLYEGAIGIYVGYYPIRRNDPHYVYVTLLKDTRLDRFLYLDSGQLIKLDPMKMVSADE